MKIGIAMFPTDKAIQPVELAQAVEERGFESLWFPEHSHIPASRICLLYTSPSPRDQRGSRMPSSA